MIQIAVNRVEGDYGFEAKDAQGHVVRMDTSPEHGGNNFGVRPMQMLLMGLGGLSILGRGRRRRLRRARGRCRCD